MKVEVLGASRLSSTLRSAADELADLAATNRAVAGRILTAAHPPILTGRLAASLTADATDTEAIVYSSVIYAPIVERRRGFLAAAARSQEDSALAAYLDHVNGCLATVKGV